MIYVVAVLVVIVGILGMMTKNLLKKVSKLEQANVDLKKTLDITNKQLDIASTTVSSDDAYDGLSGE